jgi:cytosine/adenosine deaminase-related metal-dependent hydrolase
MLISGTVVADASTVIRDGAVVVSEGEIVAVGERASMMERYPDHRELRHAIVAPGLVQAHVHTVQTLGRGRAEDCALLDWLFEYVLPLEATLTADEMAAAARLGYLELVTSGVTTVIDHLSVAHADRAFEAAGEMGIRGLLGKAMMDQRAPDGLREDTDEALAASERLLERYHGSFDDRIRYAVTPRFAVSCTEACLRGARELADAHEGIRLHTHASETRREVDTVREDTGMRNIHWLDEVGLTGEDVILAHGIWTDESERAVLAETDTHVVHCPSTNAKLGSGVAPVGAYLDRGIPVALGNDGPPANNTLDPFTEMRQAGLLQKVDSLDPTALPARRIFEMATVEGARAAGFERVGRLREGWRADIVGLSTATARATPLPDPLAHLVYSARGDDVQFTMVDGEVLVEDGELQVADSAAIRREAREVAASLDLDPARERAREVRP